MSTTGTTNSSTSTLAALHRAGDVWRAVVGRHANGRLKILDTREFRGDDTRIAPWLQSLGVERVICILPGGSVICRTCQLPNASVEQLLPALQLQAEAYLLGTAPAHRSAMAVLHAAPGETSRSGIILAWPEHTATDVPQLAGEGGPELTFAPDVAALAALLNGARPAEPLMWLDRGSGSVTMAISHANGAVFRATREDAEATEPWKQNVSRAVAETALSVGHTVPFIESLINRLQSRLASVGANQGTLIVPEELAQQFADRVDAGNRSAAWWSDYGVAVGALLATTDQLAPLTRLRLAPVLEKPSRLEHWATRLSDRRTAYTLAAACLVIALLSPLLFSGMRYGLLRVRHGDVRAQRNTVREVEHKLALYDNLANRWSMTKLLADIACNTPEGVEVDSLAMSTTRGVRASGLARADAERSALDVLNTMQKQLQDSGVFDQVDYSYEPADYGNYSFTLTADVRNPHHQVEYPRELDFGRWSLRERKYPETADEAAVADGSQAPDAEAQAISDELPEASGGEESIAVARGDTSGRNGRATSIDSTAGDVEPSEDESAESAGRARPSSRSSVSTPEGVERRSDTASRGGPGLAPGMDIPEPLSEERINAMSLDEVTQALGRVGSARNSNVGDDEVKARLKREWDLLWARNRELKKPRQNDGAAPTEGKTNG